jgi:hypothetical protein
MHGHGFEVILHADQDLGGATSAIDYDASRRCGRRSTRSSTTPA